MPELANSPAAAAFESDVMGAHSDHLVSLDQSLLHSKPTGKHCSSTDVEAACCSGRGGLPFSRDSLCGSTACKFALVAIVQLVAWVWIFTTFAPGLYNRGNCSKGSGTLWLQRFDDTSTDLSTLTFEGSTGSSAAVNLWSDPAMLVNVEVVRDEATGVASLQTLAVRHASGTGLALTLGTGPGVLQLQVNGQEVPQASAQGYGQGSYRLDTPAGVLLVETYAPQVAILTTPSGLRVSVATAEAAPGGLQVVVSIDPTKQGELSDQEPEGLLGRTLRAAALPDLTATLVPGPLLEQQVQGEEVEADAQAAAYLVPHLFAVHGPTNRFAAVEAAASRSAALDDGGL